MRERRNLALFLNLRCEHLQGAVDLSQVAALLRMARRHEWRVIHAFGVVPHTHEGARGALPGLEPLVVESLFALRSANAFSEPDLLDAVKSAGGPANLYIAGGVFSRTGLATLLAARDLGLKPRLVEEACFRTGIEAVDREQVLALLEPGDRRIRPETYDGGKVVCLEKWRV